MSNENIPPEEPKRAHNEDGTFKADDPKTPENEAYNPPKEPAGETAALKKASKPRKPKAPAKKTYRVIKSAIAPDGGDVNKYGYQPGEKVELTAEQAKYYHGIGRIEMLMDFE